VARAKKNQLLQFLTPFVDKTDFASVESGVTSGFTQRLWGTKHGVSTATVAKTPSKTLSVVRSGLFRVTLKSTEVSDFDQILWQGTHASCADQLWSFDLVDNDDSDMMSALTVIQSAASDAASAAAQANSRVLLIQSRLSDLDSRLVSDLSDVLSALAVGNSRVLLNQSRISDIQSSLSDFYSDFQSRVPKAVATQSLLSDVHSDLKSAIGGITVTIGPSDVSDIASAVLAGLTGLTASDISNIASAVDAALASRLSDILSAAQQTNSRVLVTQSLASDVYSLLSDTNSDLRSLLTTTGVQLNASMLSDLRSAITAGGGGGGITASDISDIASAVDAALASRLSDILSAAQQTNSRVLLTQSRVSDVQSFLSDMSSDLLSLLGTTGVQLNASTLSDLRSAITAGGGGGGGVTASDISDIASAVVALLASDLSDTLSATRQGVSKLVVIQSQASDIQSYLAGMSGVLSDTYSLLSDFQSDFASRFPAAIPELTGDPGATPTWAQAEALQFMWLRNNSKTTTTKRYLRNNAGTTVLSGVHSDDGTSYLQGKLG
jgi:hypothetical protein